MNCEFSKLKIFSIILLLLVGAFSIFCVLNKNSYKTFTKLIDDPYKEIRNYKAKKQLKEEMQGLSAKLKEAPPSWFLNQIKDDFSRISKLPITKNAVERTYKLHQNDHNFFRVKILNNKLYIDEIYDPKKCNSGKKFLANALFKLLSYVKLPDLDVVFYEGDIFNGSLSNDYAPIFTYALSTKNSKNRILIPDVLTLETWTTLYHQILEVNNKISWESKSNLAYWRGSATGVVDNNNYKSYEYNINNYFDFPRYKLVDFSSRNPILVDAKFTSFCNATMDVKEILEKKYPKVKSASRKEHLIHKMQITMDGNTCTYPGYLWRLLSNSVNLKQESGDVQWFYRLFKPWVHYVPVKQDLSDLQEKIEWVRAHDSEAKDISENASREVQENIKPSDLYYYLAVLLQEYSKLQDFKPEYDESFVEIKSIIK